MNHLNKWESDLSRRLASHEVKPSPMGWQQLEAKMQPPKPVSFYRKPSFWAASVGIAASIAVTAVMLPLGQNDPITEHLANELQVARERAEVKQGPALAQEAPSQSNHQDTKAVAPTPRFISSTSTACVLNNELSSASQEAAQPLNTAPKNTTAAQPAATTPTTDEAPASDAATTEATPNTKYPFIKSYFYRPYQKKQHRSYKPHLAMVTGGAPQSADLQDGYYGGIHYRSLGQRRPLRATEQATMDELINANVNRNISSHINHHAPFKVGLNVAIPLSNRFALHTGTNYTRLRTDIRSGSASAYYNTDQQLHYVGVPLDVSYQWLRVKPLQSYVMTGLELEKCVRAVRQTTYIMDNKKTVVEDKQSLANDLWQLSAHLSVGVQLNITPTIGLYLEPGVAYYFDDGEDVPHIRKDQPFQFELHGGLRFTIPTQP